VTDPLRYFRVEARELIEQISAGVLDLDQQPGPDLVARLLRYAHTLKGAARVVKQQEIADHAHAFEEVLIPHRSDNAPLPADDMRELLRLNDAIEKRVTALEPAGPAPAGPAPAGPASAAVAETATAVPVEANAPAVRAAASDVDELLDAVGEAHTRFGPLRAGGHDLERLYRSAELLADQLRGGRADGPRSAVVRLAGEIGALGRRITDTVEQVERELDEVRGRAERLRLVSTGSVLTGLHRAVRDAAEEQGKRVRFAAHGGDLRMDPQVLTQVGGAFSHVVRNAVAHGIEPEAERVAAGKPAEGSVEVEVERRGRWAAFRCRDDGRGFDLEGVRRAAESRGLLPPGGAPTPQSLVDLVLRGGISTSGTVTEVAGRGIGLDVVRDVADQLRGEVSVDTQAGVGTTVELVVPLDLLSLHGLVVEAAGTVATVPLDAVRTCMRLSPEQVRTAAATGRIAHAGQALPFLSLARAMDLGGPSDPAAGVVVVMAGEPSPVAVGVDRLAGTSTLVVRPLPDLAPATPAVGGVSIDLDGNPRLVLDPNGLARMAARFAGTEVTVDEPRQRPPILVVDDSLTTRELERSILESAGYEVDMAASGEEGLAKARHRGYALFLTDIDMPGIDGFTFVERTRADPDLAATPAILVSSRDGSGDRTRGAEVGADAYVVKGEFDQQELLTHIRRLVP
jgi:two-component system chemotaxis sensor kinase CheA